MNFFLPFDTLTRVSGGLVAEGSAPVESAIAAAKPDLAVTEMASVPQTGKLTFCRVINGILKVGVELWDALAITKVINHVYRGVCLIGTPGAGDTVTIDKCALVDHPSALNKRSGNETFLHVSEVFKMAIPSRTAAPNGQPENPYKEIRLDGSAESNKRAMELIAFARQQRIESADRTGRDFFNWLRARSK